jgi:cyanate permease
MIGKLAAALGLVIFGFLADKTSFSASWVVSALLLLILIPVYLRVKKKEFLKVKTKPIDSNFLI